jgi:hypothetical protein
MTRATRRLVARWMILVMVLAQMAVSAYACPTTLQPGSASRVAETSIMTARVESLAMPTSNALVASDFSRDPMVNCDAMQGHLDAAAPNLCDACCHHDQQPDHASRLAAPTAILNSLYAVPARVSVPVPVRFDAPSSSDLAAAAPPRTVLHCCWRI